MSLTSSSSSQLASCVTIPCRYLCTSALGCELYHIYGGIVAQSLIPDAARPSSWHSSTDQAAAPSSSQQPLMEVVLFTLPRRSTGLACDDIECMDEASAARLITGVVFTTMLEQSSSCYQWERSGLAQFLERSTSQEQLDIVSSLCLEPELFDVSLPLSMSGTREERIEGVRRVLPLVLCKLPILSHTGSRSALVESNTDDLTTVSVEYHTNLQQIMLTGGISSMPPLVDDAALGMHAHVRDTLANMTMQLAAPGIVAKKQSSHSMQ